MTYRILPLLAAVFTLAACGGESAETAPVAEGPEGVTVVPAADGTAPATPAAPVAQPAAPATGAFLDPNTATAEQLLMVPGFDQPLADAVVQGRPYADMTAVDRVVAARLSEEQRDAAYGRLWMPIDLNAASREEILLVPGVGDRMAHEFEEYRPYRTIDQFRREIGKYVDEAEVARLERFVVLR